MTRPALTGPRDCPTCGKHFEQWQRRSFYIHTVECLRRKVAARKAEEK